MPGLDVRARAFKQEIETELVKYLVRQAPLGFVIGTLTVAAVAMVLWNAAPRNLLLLWLVSIALLTVPAFVVVWRFTRATHVSEKIVSWQRALAISYGLAGAGWGAASILLYPKVATPYHQVFLLFVLGGSGVGGMAALAPVRAAFIAYLTATFVPMIGQLLAGGYPSSIATGVLLLAFWLATIVLASELRALLVRSIQLRFENLELIDNLSLAKDDAEEASRAKSAFLANVSHELRTPLALILGPTRKLLTSCGEEARRDLETVERNAQGLLKHVNDLLDVAKLEVGQMELDRVHLDLAELVRRTTSLFEVLASEREVELSVGTPDSLPVMGDPEKLERVLLNLLSNAMKFVPDGGRVQVELGVEGDDVVVSVEDNGPGVPVALREAIFERFRRGDDSATRRFGGTGLGLAIAKELVDCHGGHIEVGDGSDGGAVFRVKLPLAALASSGGAVEATSANHATVRASLDEVARQTVQELRLRSDPSGAIWANGGQSLVLVIEDNLEMSRYLVDCLAADYRVATAFDGRQGLERALELRPDLILSDIMMPAMGGEALVYEMRAHAELEGIPIIVLTAKADDELRVRLLRAGAQDFLTKPVASEELRARVANLVMLKRTRDVLQRALSSQSRDLATLADQLAAANRSKDEFLAVLSHELRTPLMPIISWAFLLREGELDAAATQHALEAIERNGKLEARIVEDLLDVSRAITGKLRLNVRPIALDPVIREAIEAVRPAAEAKGVALDVTRDGEAGLISGDPERLQQVIWNLTSNAVKFTPPGGRVEIRLAGHRQYLRLTVSDNGCGIPRALLPRIFERFWQADSSITRTQGGLGLGLAVVRHLVELHGGAVRAESAGEGLGATFTVTLPLLSSSLALSVDNSGPRPPVGVEDPAGSLRCQGLKVLVVDDDEDTCEILGVILEQAGAEVRMCVSATQALTAMDSWVPDILVSDIAMPGEDGYTLIRKVRARKTEVGGAVPAVALSAYGRDEDRTKALSAGFQVHVGKPVAPSRLIDIVATMAGHGGGAQSSRASNPRH